MNRLGPMGIVALGGAFGSKGSIAGASGLVDVDGAFGSSGSIAGGASSVANFNGVFESSGFATGGFINDPLVDDGIEKLAGLSLNSAAACPVLANNSAKAVDNMVC